MKKIVFFTVLFALLGAAGYWWFEEGYGLLTAAGVFALRVGPMFVWRITLRAMRRAIVRLVRALGVYVRRRLATPLDRLGRLWKGSWLLRVCILVPPLIATCIVAYELEGVLEFVALFPVPFLFTAIFPEGFGMLAFAYLMRFLGAYGLEGLVTKLLDFLPEDTRAKYRARRHRAWISIADRTRFVRTHANRAIRSVRKRMRPNPSKQ